VRSAIDFETVDAAVGRLLPQAVEFLGRMVQAGGLVGDEAAVQGVVADELARLGFAVEHLPIPDDIGSRPGAGVPQCSYDGRHNVVGRRDGRGRSLLINGHVDVVPVGDLRLWSSDPFSPVVRDGWLHGRGAGDMKSGIAMATLAIEALLTAVPDALTGPLSFVSVIEEECTGNGTLASAHAGVVADGVLIPEPSQLSLSLEGIGVLWCEIAVEGASVHAADPRAGANAIESTMPILTALRRLEAEIATEVDGTHRLNIGTFRAGDWQSNVPDVARLGVRLGFPTVWSQADALARLEAAVAAAAADDPWLAAHPPTVTPNGLRAEGYSQAANHELVELVAAAHCDVVGTEPEQMPGSATTDARFYLNQFDIPALCYGPRVRNIHGPDEAVELSSIEVGARVFTRAMTEWFA
jgi:acetylornithine deacetylase